MAALDQASLDFRVKYVACLGLALDAPSLGLIAYVLLDNKGVLDENHALVEAELLVGAVVVRKEMEHSVEHTSHFVNLVALVHSLICLIDQVQEAPEGNEAVALHDFPEARGVGDKVVAGFLPVALILWLAHALLRRKPQAEEWLQLRDTDRLEIVGII